MVSDHSRRRRFAGGCLTVAYSLRQPVLFATTALEFLGSVMPAWKNLTERRLKALMDVRNPRQGALNITKTDWREMVYSPKECGKDYHRESHFEYFEFQFLEEAKKKLVYFNVAALLGARIGLTKAGKETSRRYQR